MVIDENNGLKMSDEDIIRAVKPAAKPAPTFPQDPFPKGYENTPGGVYIPRDVGTVIPQGSRDMAANAGTGGAETLPFGFKRLDNGMIVNAGQSTLTGTIYPSRAVTDPHANAIPLPIPKQGLESTPEADTSALGGVSQPSVSKPTTPGGDYVISRGSTGEPLLTNQPGAESWNGFRQPIKPLRPAQMNVIPEAATDTLPANTLLSYDEGDYNPATGKRTSLRSMEGTGGQVIQPIMDAETQKLVDARKAQTLPALNSLNQTLDEANLMEGAHGTHAGRQAQAILANRREKAMKAFSDKWGVDLKAMELQATLPKLQAEADYYKARANQENALALRQGKATTQEAQLLDMSKAIAHQLTSDVTLDDKQRTELQQQWNNIHEMLGSLAKEQQPKPTQVPTAKPSWDEFFKAARAKESNRQFSDDQLKAYYQKNYGG